MKLLCTAALPLTTHLPHNHLAPRLLHLLSHTPHLKLPEQLFLIHMFFHILPLNPPPICRIPDSQDILA